MQDVDETDLESFVYSLWNWAAVNGTEGKALTPNDLLEAFHNWREEQKRGTHK